MGENRLQRIREERGAIGLVSAALDARDLYDQGIVCDCEEPILVGYALMCQACLRENVGQRERKECAMAAPHAFEAPRRGHPDMCAFCAAWKDDPRHVVGQQGGQGETERQEP